jgi:hypothetical protein
MKELAKTIVRRLLAQRGLVITRVGKASNNFSLGYISASKTVSTAEHEGLYVEVLSEKLF